MRRPFRLTRQAEHSLEHIARWTIETFGPRQAEIYEAELISECEAIASGHAHGRDCSSLVEGAQGMRYVRAGGHYVVYLDRLDQIIILDILHARSDLPRHIAVLSARRDGM